MSTATQQKCQTGRCGRAVVGGRKRCFECLERARKCNRERLQKRRDAGMCQSCGREEPMAEYTRCRRCAERYYGFTGLTPKAAATAKPVAYDPSAWYMTFDRDNSPTVFEQAANPEQS